MTVAAALLVAALIALAGTLLLAVVAWARFVRFAPAPAEGPSASGAVASGATQYAGLLLALTFTLGALAMRVALTGHAPWSNLYEFSQAFAATILASYLLLARRMPIGGLAPFVALIAGALLGYALALPDEALPLVPALQAPLLLTIHVGAAMLAYAISAVAFAAAAGELLQRRAGGRLAAIPPAAVCRTAAHRAVLLAFPVLTVAIALGSVWANLAWRSYWNNDPKELSAAATWLVYAAYLHIAGRRDRWAAMAPWLLVVGFAAVLFTFLGAGLLFVGQHSYASS